MSAATPVDPRSAGSRRSCSGERAGAAGGVAARAAEDLEGALSTVLEPVLAEAVPGGLSPDVARRGACGVLPAVLALSRLRECPLLEPWDGLVHRRCRLSPAAAEPQGGGPEAAAGRAGETSVAPVLRRRVRGGWELVSAATQVDGVNVVHDLARRLGTGATSSEGVPGRDRRVAGPAGSSVPAAGDDLAGRSGGAALADGVLGLRLTRQDVAGWARAAGDDNVLHREPGRAVLYGVVVGHDEVVAHGLLLAALSLAVLPAAPGSGTELRMTAPLGVGAQGAHLEVDLSTGEVGDGGRTLLRRRDYQ